MVIDAKGMVAWSLIADKALCPMCKQQFQPITCGFTRCLWAFDRRKIGSNNTMVDVEGDWQAASYDMYDRFQADNNQVQWHMLVLSAKFATPDVGAQPGSTICPICFEVPYGQAKHTTSCGHCFHASCIAAWKRYQPNGGCPVCRNPL